MPLLGTSAYLLMNKTTLVLIRQVHDLNNIFHIINILLLHSMHMRPQLHSVYSCFYRCYTLAHVVTHATTTNANSEEQIRTKFCIGCQLENFLILQTHSCNGLVL